MLWRGYVHYEDYLLYFTTILPLITSYSKGHRSICANQNQERTSCRYVLMSQFCEFIRGSLVLVLQFKLQTFKKSNFQNKTLKKNYLEKGYKNISEALQYSSRGEPIPKWTENQNVEVIDRSRKKAASQEPRQVQQTTFHSYTRQIISELLKLYLGKDHQWSKKRVCIWGKMPAQSVN